MALWRLMAERRTMSASSALPMGTPPFALPSDAMSVSLRPTLRMKRRSRRTANSGGSPAGLSDPLAEDESVLSGLHAAYGNVLRGDAGLFAQYDEQTRRGELDYPFEEGMLSLLEATARCWCFDARTERRIPPLLSLHAPSRRITWQVARHLAGECRSHMARIPPMLFVELLNRAVRDLTSGRETEEGSASTSQVAVQVIGSTGAAGQGRVAGLTETASLADFIVRNFGASRGDAGSGRAGRGAALPPTRDTMSVGSRAAIQVMEYLYVCMEEMGREADQGGPARPTILFIDDVEEALLGRRGGDVIMREVYTWAAFSETSGRRTMFGARFPTVSDRSDVAAAAEENGEPEEDSSSPKGSGSSKSVSLPIQALADLFLSAKSTGGAGNRDESGAPPTNVRVDGPFLRLFVSGQQNDCRRRVQLGQMLARDRQHDMFDANLLQLRVLARNKWNVRFDLGVSSSHAYPSEARGVWEELAVAGRGVLCKRRLSRDECNEVALYALGQEDGGNDGEVASDLAARSSHPREPSRDTIRVALNHMIEARHDVNQLSTSDLAHMLAERHVSTQTLSKYERRFLNCISTATTRTFFRDISLPAATIHTLRTMTTLPLTHPELFTHGVLRQSFTGVLLFGPPGTGKTMLARAVAQESGAAFLAVNLSNIFDMWVGEGEKNVKGLFGLARKLAPSIIFIDEIDALLERRSSTASRSSRIEVVNEFMSQWDGLASNLNAGVVVMGATNRPFVLDDAVLRRLPRRLLVDLPTAEARLAILHGLLADNAVDSELMECLPRVAERMELYSGSDLKNVAIAAALKAAVRATVHGGTAVILRDDFEEAMREVPASLSDQMESLGEIRRWNQTYGESSGVGASKKFGFAP